jgi:hypothetical protein
MMAVDSTKVRLPKQSICDSDEDVSHPRGDDSSEKVSPQTSDGCAVILWTCG